MSAAGEGRGAAESCGEPLGHRGMAGAEGRGGLSSGTGGKAPSGTGRWAAGAQTAGPPG